MLQRNQMMDPAQIQLVNEAVLVEVLVEVKALQVPVLLMDLEAKVEEEERVMAKALQVLERLLEPLH